MTEETPNPLKKVTPYLSLSRDGHPAPSIEMLSLLSIRKDVCYHPSGAVNVLSWSKPSKLRHVTNDPPPWTTALRGILTWAACLQTERYGGLNDA